MKRVGLLLTVVAAMMATPSVAYAGPHYEKGWGDGRLVNLQITQGASEAKGRSVPEYVIGPIDDSSPLNEAEDGFGPYDLVVHTPGPSYSSLFRPTAVVPSGSADEGTVAWRVVQAGNDQILLAYAADLGSGLVSLNSVARIEQASALGLVEFVDFGITEVCHVIP
ncbi:MAG: hypothetical protein ABR507_04545 [Actinomycetota bacterium]|nr:hypothetical protein [Actinomycetota bacterium]